MREWWLRTLLVLQAPRPVFAALRDDSDDSAGDRAEPVLLVVWLFLAGGITGGAAYWFFGAVLYGSARALGSAGSYRRARHVLAFASVPIAISLVLAPAGHTVFRWLLLPFVAWAAVLLVIGVRSVHGWTWARAGAAAVVPAVAAGVLLALG